MSDTELLEDRLAIPPYNVSLILTERDVANGVPKSYLCMLEAENYSADMLQHILKAPESTLDLDTATPVLEGNEAGLITVTW